MTAFHAFVQVVSAEGQLLGEALDLGEVADNSEMSPSVAATREGGLYVSWTRMQASGDTVRHGLISRGGDGWEIEPVDAWTGTSTGARSAIAPDDKPRARAMYERVLDLVGDAGDDGKVVYGLQWADEATRGIERLDRK